MSIRPFAIVTTEVYDSTINAYKSLFFLICKVLWSSVNCFLFLSVDF